jgi:acetyl esterase
MSELHPEAEEFLGTIEDRGVLPFHTLSVDGAREMLDQAFEPGELPIPPATITDRSIDVEGESVDLRFYRPDDSSAVSTGGRRPAFLYLHGGGWVLGSLDSADAVCRYLADRSGWDVVSVGYRLAPEHPFPAAVIDAYGALVWLAEHGPSVGVDPGRIVVAGDSAGGTLATVASLLARNRDGPSVAGQLLVYPQTDYAFDTASYRENAEGYYLTRADMRWFWDHYLPDPIHGRNPYASPLRERDLGGLPPAYVIGCEFDPLRDDGRRYAERLDAAGVPVRYREYDGMIHGFFTKVTRMAIAGEAIDEAVDVVDSMVEF